MVFFGSFVVNQTFFILHLFKKKTSIKNIIPRRDSQNESRSSPWNSTASQNPLTGNDWRCLTLNKSCYFKFHLEWGYHIKITSCVNISLYLIQGHLCLKKFTKSMTKKLNHSINLDSYRTAPGFAESAESLYLKKNIYFFLYLKTGNYHHLILDFQRIGPSADSFTESRCLSTSCLSPFYVIFFEASHWPSSRGGG